MSFNVIATEPFEKKVKATISDKVTAGVISRISIYYQQKQAQQYLSGLLLLIFQHKIKPILKAIPRTELYPPGRAVDGQGARSALYPVLVGLSLLVKAGDL